MLIEQVVRFCFHYDGLIDDEVRTKVASELGEPAFIESLINTIVIKAKNSKNIDVKKVQELLLELEKIRLELEYKDRISVS